MIAATTTITSDELAAICNEAATQQSKWIQLDEARSRELTWSVRRHRRTYITFKVAISEVANGRRQLASRITYYKTMQSTVLFIPVFPKTMVELSSYEGFMQRLGEIIRHADPNATVEMSG